MIVPPITGRADMKRGTTRQPSSMEPFLALILRDLQRLMPGGRLGQEFPWNVYFMFSGDGALVKPMLKSVSDGGNEGGVQARC